MSSQDIDTIVTVENLSICENLNQIFHYQPIELGSGDQDMKKRKITWPGPDSHLTEEPERGMDQPGNSDCQAVKIGKNIFQNQKISS